MVSIVKGKRGFELSANFIVMLILATLALSMGIILLHKISSNSNSLTGKSYKDFMKELVNVDCSDSLRVCVSPQSVSSYPGHHVVYSLRINNNYDTPVSFKVSAFEVDDNGDPITVGSKISSIPSYIGVVPAYSHKEFPVVVMPALGENPGVYNIKIVVKDNRTSSWEVYSNKIVQLKVK